MIKSTKNQLSISVLSNEVKENSFRIFFHLMLLLNPLHRCKSSAFRPLSKCPAKIQVDFGPREILSIVLSPKMSGVLSILFWSIQLYISCMSVCYDTLKTLESNFHPSFFKMNIWPFSLNDEFLQKYALVRFLGSL